MSAPANPKSALPLESYPARMRPDQVALYLNVSVDLVTDLIDSGAMQAVNLAGPGSVRSNYRISREAVAAFEQRRTA